MSLSRLFLYAYVIPFTATSPTFGIFISWHKGVLRRRQRLKHAKTSMWNFEKGEWAFTRHAKSLSFSHFPSYTIYIHRIGCTVHTCTHKRTLYSPSKAPPATPQNPGLRRIYIHTLTHTGCTPALAHPLHVYYKGIHEIWLSEESE